VDDLVLSKGWEFAMRIVLRTGMVLLLGGLSGCVVAPPPPLQPVPLVAVPGAAKTEAEFRQDDTTCRTAAAPLPPAPSQPATSGVQVPPGPAPAEAYLRCMSAHNNVVQPVAQAEPALYGYYPAYPVYAGLYDPYPWLYGGYYGGFGFYGRCCGGYRGGYGGFRDAGFGGGGYGGGGFHGGWFGRGR
jgi:hypothetical protein